jgi:hypothetical protein
MISTDSYWDHEQCCWVAYAASEREVPADAVPEQRADEPVTDPAPVPTL